MEPVRVEKWHCIRCGRHVICRPDTLALLGWRFFALGPVCPQCQAMVGEKSPDRL